ncbi:MAG TPA: radical SAM protein, partial [Polyangia bacterium]|nr:radical SAM protein [Polyangia bacterium]
MDARRRFDALVKVLELRLLGRRRPLVVTWPITDRCNFSCRTCKRWRRESAELGTAEALSVIEQLARLGTQRISISGGEPLLRDDLGELLGHARRRGVAVVVTTNGSLVSERLPALAGAELVKLSLDGDREVHDHLRGAGSFDLVLEAARALRSAGRRFVFNTVLSAVNLDRPEDAIRLAEEFETRVRFTTINTVHASQAEIADLEPPSPRAHARAIDRIAAARRAGRPVANSPAGLRYLRTWPGGRRDFPCFAGLALAHLAADGGLYPCIFMEGRMPGRDISALGIAEAFAGLANPACGRCWCGGT